jgi:hypothetical protein
MAQVAKIMEPKPVKTFAKQTWQNTTPSKNSWSRQDQKKVDTFNKIFQKQEEKPIKRWFDDWEEPALTSTLDYGLLEEEDLHAIEIYEFTKSLFSYANSPIDEEQYLEDVLDDLAEYNVTPQEIAKYVIDDYASNFSNYFPKASSVDFIQYTNEVVDLLEDMLVLYPEIRLTVTTIKSMINKFIENETNK